MVVQLLEKQCLGVCARTLPLEMYGMHPSGRLGRQSKCRDCKTGELREYKHKYPEKVAACITRWRRNNPDTVRAYARKWARKDSSKERHWSRSLETTYGITADEYYALLAFQEGKCAICKCLPGEGDKLHVDHCHTSTTIRGLLCGTCNRGLGMFRDDPRLMSSAIDYLRQS